MGKITTKVALVSMLIVALAATAALAATFNGTSGNDTLTGTSGDDAMYGLGGRDIIEGYSGNDKISGGDGNDARGLLLKDPNLSSEGLSGGPGDDTVYGNNGNDYVFDGGGKDVLNGGFGDDRLRSSPDGVRDEIYCGSGRDLALVGESMDFVASDCETTRQVGKVGS